MQLNFYNTIDLSNSELATAKVSVKKQADRILDIIRVRNKSMTPFEVHFFYVQKYPNCPITSIRRAMTNLTDQNKLTKTTDKKIEVYGKPNYKWALVTTD